MFLFHDLFAISPSRYAIKGSAEGSTLTILVSRLAHNVPIALPASPPAILMQFEQTVTFPPVQFFHMYTYFLA